MKSYGRASTLLLRTGPEHVRSVGAALAGDWQSAPPIELVLRKVTGEAPAVAACFGAASERDLVPDAS